MDSLHGAKKGESRWKILRFIRLAGNQLRTVESYDRFFVKKKKALAFVVCTEDIC